jgi:alpha/beta superfamily hydrolase
VTAVRFTTADGISLEGEIRQASGDARGTAVLCHPHPRHGGSKDHPILWTLRNDLAARRGLTVLTFNFRGIMGSEGAYGGGEAELQDVAAAVDVIRREDDGPTVLVGWSFGAWVALRHAVTDHRIAAAALIGFPLAAALSSRRPLPSLGELEDLAIPVLLIAGDGDQFCPVTDMRNLASWIPRAQTVVFDGADHFFGRRERQLAEEVGSWIDGALGGQTSRESR